jgi:hypothetical protein
MRFLLPAIATALGALLLAAAAEADFQTLYDDYRADGAIDGCAYTAGELSNGLGDIPADVRQYDPGFPEALNAALDQVAAGCHAAPAAVSRNEVTAADGSPGPAVPHALAFKATGSDRGLPGVLIALIAVLAAGLAAAGVFALARYYGWDLRLRRGSAGP